MNQDDRDARDAAGVGPYAKELDRLVPMNSVRSWKVAAGEPDIRGWEVQTVSNRKIGTVQDLLIDAGAGEVVLLDVDLSGTNRHALVPIRIVQIDRERRVVLVDSADMPDPGAGRIQASKPGERVDEADAISYPRTDREVVIGRASNADNLTARDREISPDDLSTDAAERRRTERRQIHRMNTDI